MIGKNYSRFLKKKSKNTNVRCVSVAILGQHHGRSMEPLEETTVEKLKLPLFIVNLWLQ